MKMKQVSFAAAVLCITSPLFGLAPRSVVAAVTGSLCLNAVAGPDQRSGVEAEHLAVREFLESLGLENNLPISAWSRVMLDAEAFPELPYHMSVGPDDARSGAVAKISLLGYALIALDDQTVISELVESIDQVNFSATGYVRGKVELSCLELALICRSSTNVPLRIMWHQQLSAFDLAEVARKTRGAELKDVEGMPDRVSANMLNNFYLAALSYLIEEDGSTLEFFASEAMYVGVPSSELWASAAIKRGLTGVPLVPSSESRKPDLFAEDLLSIASRKEKYSILVYAFIQSGDPFDLALYDSIGTLEIDPGLTQWEVSGASSLWKAFSAHHRKRGGGIEDLVAVPVISHALDQGYRFEILQTLLREGHSPLAVDREGRAAIDEMLQQPALHAAALYAVLWESAKNERSALGDRGEILRQLRERNPEIVELFGDAHTVEQFIEVMQAPGR